MIVNDSMSDSRFMMLMIEDNPDDAFLILHAVTTSFPNAECHHAPGRKELESFLNAGKLPDIILSDWSLPQFDGLSALDMVRARDIDVPFIIVSGKIGEEAAVLAIRRGAYDYVLKDALGRLPTAILHALDFQNHEKFKKKDLALDALLSKAMSLAKSPEGYCLNVIRLMRELCPAIKLGILLYSNGESRIDRWMGNKRLTSTDAENSAGFFSRTMTMGEEAIGEIQIRYPEISTMDQAELFAHFANRMEAALQRMISQVKISAQIRNISFLKLISRTISPDMNFESVMDPLLEQIREFLNCDAISLYMKDKDGEHLSCRAQNGFRTGLVENAKIAFGQPNVGLAALEQRIVSVPAFKGRVEDKAFAALITEEKFVAQHCAPIIIAGKTVGVLEVFQREAFSPSQDWLILFDAIAMQTGLALDYNSIYFDLQKAYLDLELSYQATIEGWSSAIDFRDEETEGHSRRVAALTIALAAKLGASKDEITFIHRGALLHDVGKIGIPDSILKKAGPLDEKEWMLMRRHPYIANEMLAGIPYLKPSLDIPLYHHERWDGSGYPEGLKGETIPFAARLFAIIDVFDALTSDRPYRKAWTKEAALLYIHDQAGKLFDPKLSASFLDMMKGGDR